VALGIFSAVRRRVLAHRRLAAFALTAAAVALGLHAVLPAPPPTATLTVAARDLPAGEVLTTADLAEVAVAPSAVPSGAQVEPVGSTLAAPLRQGEPVTDLRLVGPQLTVGQPGVVALPVRLPDAAMAGLLSVGDRLRLLSTDPHSGTTSTVASGVRVLGLPPADGGAAGGGASGLGGRLVLIGVADGLVDAVTSAAVGGYLTFAYDE